MNTSEPTAQCRDHLHADPGIDTVLDELTVDYGGGSREYCAAFREGAMAMHFHEKANRIVQASFDFGAHLLRQREWSEQTFGPGALAQRVIDHIRKELLEIEAAPHDLIEWIDVVILALDGAWRTGASPAEIIAALASKHATNELREWPDWRTADPTKPIEHIRDGESIHTSTPDRATVRTSGINGVPPRTS